MEVLVISICVTLVGRLRLGRGRNRRDRNLCTPQVSVPSDGQLMWTILSTPIEVRGGHVSFSRLRNKLREAQSLVQGHTHHGSHAFLIPRVMTRARAGGPEGDMVTGQTSHRLAFNKHKPVLERREDHKLKAGHPQLHTKAGGRRIYETISKKIQKEGRKKEVRGWRKGSVVNSTCCYCRRSRFESQHPHGGSFPSVPPVPGDRSSPLASVGTRYTHGTQAYIKTEQS